MHPALRIILPNLHLDFPQRNLNLDVVFQTSKRNVCQRRRQRGLAQLFTGFHACGRRGRIQLHAPAGRILLGFFGSTCTYAATLACELASSSRLKCRQSALVGTHCPCNKFMHQKLRVLDDLLDVWTPSDPIPSSTFESTNPWPRLSP